VTLWAALSAGRPPESLDGQPGIGEDVSKGAWYDPPSY
jgi:hypothetical protein